MTNTTKNALDLAGRILAYILIIGSLIGVCCYYAHGQTPYPGTTKEICAAHGQQYDAKAKGCVVKIVKPALPSTTPTRRVNKDNGEAK